eukprot:scaffold33577_cov132-Skeletonema_dohrnii-CCMP3373.AAC.3
MSASELKVSTPIVMVVSKILQKRVSKVSSHQSQIPGTRSPSIRLGEKSRGHNQERNRMALRSAATIARGLFSLISCQMALKPSSTPSPKKPRGHYFPKGILSRRRGSVTFRQATDAGCVERTPPTSTNTIQQSTDTSLYIHHISITEKIR